MKYETDIFKITNSLDRNKLTYTFFIYSWWEVFKSPLLIGTKLQGLLPGGKGIDHVAQICDYYQDKDGNWIPEFFEASVSKNGMVRISMPDKIQKFKGMIIFEELNFIVDKKKAKEFELAGKEFGYSKMQAFISGFPFGLLDWTFKLLPSYGKDGFCSRLAAYFGKNNQKVPQMQKINPDTISPKEMHKLNLAKKTGGRRLFFKK